jgi:CelD/BcsL family acetyltransferase involved in cellulose biosynthesis
MQQVDPFTFPDWNECILAIPHSSIFHTTNWLRVLQESYGYRPYYFACFEGEKLAVLLPFMEVKSWITGVRGVSLPFSDYCEPLLDETAHYPELLDQVILAARRLKWKFLEMRGADALFRGAPPYTVYYRHTLVLPANEEVVFSGLRSNYRAKIRKAYRNDLKVEILRSPDAIAEYYRLHCLTRKRHGLPPQPTCFFKKIHEHIIAKDFGFVILVSHQGRNVAGAIFFYFGDRVMYKFGASDRRYQHLHPNYLLFWHAIQWLCHNGYKELCFGRSAASDKGLVQFKGGWGTNKSPLYYYKYDLKTTSFVENLNQAVENGYAISKKMPIMLLKLVGSVLYPHIG